MSTSYPPLNTIANLLKKTKMSVKHKPSKPKLTGNKPNRY